jgi:hypothetical protein
MGLSGILSAVFRDKLERMRGREDSAVRKCHFLSHSKGIPVKIDVVWTED